MLRAQKNILLIDDEIEEHLFFKSALQDLSEMNYSVSSAYNDVQALDYLLKKDSYHKDSSPSPHLIVLDINMPKGEGIDFLSRIKAQQSLQEIPVYILTKDADKSNETKCNQLGCAGYAIKKNTLPEMRNLLLRILQQAR